MTHSLHRRGTIENLREDYVLMIKYSREVKIEGADEKMRQAWEIISHYEQDLENFGNHDPNWDNDEIYDMEELKKADSRIIHVVFKDREVLKACLEEIKNKELGLNVLISGVYEEVRKICLEIGLAPHTVNQSLGTHGKTQLLLEGEALEIHTMCGHAMVAPNLIRNMVKKIDEGTISTKDAAKKLSRMCDCGIFNPYRAEKLLTKLSVKD